MLSSVGEDRSTLLLVSSPPLFTLPGLLLLFFPEGLMLMLVLLAEGLLTTSLDADLLGVCRDFVPSLFTLGEMLFFRECLGDRV